MFQKSSLKVYLAVVSSIVVVVVLMINLTVLPKLAETLAEISPVQVELIKNRIYALTAGVLIFILLFNFYFWRLDNKLGKEEKKAETIFKMNPTDPVAQEKLQQIKTKRNRYIALSETIFMIILGVAIGFITISLIKPLYQLLGTM